MQEVIAMSTPIPKHSTQTVDAFPQLDQAPGGSFARILLEEGIINGHELDKACRVQKKLGNDKLLSAILLDLSIISEDDHRRFTRKYGHTFRFGDLQCELRNISLEQLREAEAAMSTHAGKRMGEILLELGFINERELAQALSDQINIPLMHLEFEIVNMELVRQFSPVFLQKNLVIPFDQGETKVSIIMADPFNKEVIREIEQRLGKKADISIGVRPSIISLLSRLEHSASASDQRGSVDNAVDVVESLLLAAVRNRASDIHIEPLSDHVRIRFRMDGVLIHHMDIPTELAQRVISSLKVMTGLDIADQRRHQDGRMSREVGHVAVDFRISTYVTIYGENMVMRILRRDGGLKTLEQIHMNKSMMERYKHEALDAPTGVILVTGPTGSGKTTTLYASVDYLNHPNTKIITLEDPVEFAVDGIMQCSVDIKAGRTFGDSLKAIVRQDPDIIVLGEVRDRMSAEVAVQAALTGHKVLTTFHTEDSIGGLLRLLDMGIETFLISSTVVSILAQRLARCICPDCSQAYLPDPRIAQFIGIDQETLKNHTFYRGIGCLTCNGTGYFSRTGLHELLVLNDEVRSAILEKRTSQAIRQISCETTNLLSLMECGMYKVLKGVTTVEEVYRIAPRAYSERSVGEVMQLMEE